MLEDVEGAEVRLEAYITKYTSIRRLEAYSNKYTRIQVYSPSILVYEYLMILYHQVY